MIAPHLKYREDRAKAIPEKGGCHSCDAAWTGPNSRSEAHQHHAETGHPIWVECRMPSEP